MLFFLYFFPSFFLVYEFLFILHMSLVYTTLPALPGPFLASPSLCNFNFQTCFLCSHFHPLSLTLALSLLPLASNWPPLYWLQPKMMSLIILVEIMWLSVCLCACACALACNRMCECVCVLYLAKVIGFKWGWRVCMYGHVWTMQLLKRRWVNKKIKTQKALASKDQTSRPPAEIF